VSDIFALLFCYFYQLPADEAADSSNAVSHFTCEQSAATDHCASSVVNGIIHRPSMMQDKCCPDERRTASSNSVVRNDCTSFHSTHHRSGSAGVSSALPSSSCPV